MSSRDCYITPPPVNQSMNAHVTYRFGQCTCRPERVTFGEVTVGGEGDVDSSDDLDDSS